MSIHVLTDQCALNLDGSFKDASEISWVHDPDDELPTNTSGSGLTGLHNFTFNIYCPIFEFIMQVVVSTSATDHEWMK